MFTKGEFSESIDEWTLKFHKPSLEANYMSHKEQLYQRSCVPRVVGYTGIIMTVGFFFIARKHYLAGQTYLAFANILTVLVGNFGVLLEILIQKYTRQKLVRGFMMSTCAYFCFSFYATRLLPSPGLLPGAAAIMMNIFSAINQLAYNWISATLAQAAGQLITTICIIQGYSGKMEFSSLLIHLINFNSGIIISAVLYYGFERQARQVAFLQWNIEKELAAWKRLVNGLPVGLFVADRDSVIYANRTCIKTTLAVDVVDSGEETVSQYRDQFNQSLRAIVRSAQSSDSSRENLKELSDQKRSLHDELFGKREPADLKGERFEFRRSGAKPQPLAINTIEFRRGKGRYRVCSLWDQSVYEELEAERLSAQCQKTFCAMFTHELRNPLHGILGIFESLGASPAPSRQRYACRMGISTGQTMMCIINDILDLSQIEVNKFKLALVEFNPAEVIAECLEIMQFQYEKKGVLLKSIVRKSVPTFIFNDANRYKQIVLNLLGNALKFTTKGFTEIKVKYDVAAWKLVTKVRDTGSGIPKAEQKNLFSLYGKLQCSAPSNPLGAGLGLLICKRLTEAMGGTIQLKSLSGEGSVFKFTIENRKEAPLITTMANEEEESLAVADENVNEIHVRYSLTQGPCGRYSSVTSPAQRSASRVLVVDDDYACAFVMEENFRAQNVRTEVALSGEDAVRKFRTSLDANEPYRLIILDINMPGKDGLETAREIVEACSKAEKRRPTIIGLSGDADEGLKEKCKLAGMTDVLQKPCGRATLNQALRRHRVVLAY